MKFLVIFFVQDHLGLVMRKVIFEVSNQIKPVYSATETSNSFENVSNIINHVTTR